MINNPFSKKELLYGAGIVVGTIVLLNFLFRKKMKPITLKGGYVVPAGTPNMADALHSFERRKSDGFGGRMSTKIKEALVELYKKGINPDITKLVINVDSKKYKVDWEATIEPSKDGKAYTGIMTYGSAGSGADNRAINQEATMKQKVGGKNYKLVLDFKNPSGIYIRQFFHKYTRDEYPSH
jgi:hypothetical protein